MTPPQIGDTLLVNVVPTPPMGMVNEQARNRQVKWRNLVTCPGDMLAVEGLQPPILESTGDLVMGADTNKLQIQNKRQRHKLQDKQTPTPSWTKNTGDLILPPNQEHHTKYCNEMWPAGLATSHSAGKLLAEWSQLGCPTKTGKPWTKNKMWEAVAQEPH
jgi:hypothetical protein